MKKYLVLLSVLMLFIITSGCSTTNIVVSWHDNSVPPFSLKKPFVIAIVPQQVVRAKTEDEFVNSLRLSGIEALASYRSFPDAKNMTKDAVKGLMPSIGCDSIIVSRLVDTKEETVVVPARTEVTSSGQSAVGAYGGTRYYGGPYVGPYGGPPHYNHFDTYYETNMNIVTTPAFSYIDKVYVVESNIYRVKDSKLLWTATTETREVDSIDKAIADFTSIIMQDIRKSQLF